MACWKIRYSHGRLERYRSNVSTSRIIWIIRKQRLTSHTFFLIQFPDNNRTLWWQCSRRPTYYGQRSIHNGRVVWELCCHRRKFVVQVLSMQYSQTKVFLETNNFLYGANMIWTWLARYVLLSVCISASCHLEQSRNTVWYKGSQFMHKCISMRCPIF